MKKLSLERLITTANSKLNVFKTRDDLLLINVSIEKAINSNKKYGGWYGDADSTIDGKHYKVSIQIPNNLITKDISEISSGTFNFGISSVSINAYGKLSVVVSSISILGGSSRDDINQELYDYCKSKGYLKRKKKKLPKTISSILCITSPGSTIKGDVLSTTGLSESKVKILNVSTSEKIANIILKTYGVDIIVLYRGGHQDVAMNMFSEVPILDAIQKSKTPVCVALGHEIDVPFVYTVADATFATPSSFGKSVASINANFIHKKKLSSSRKSKFILYMIILILILVLTYTQTNLLPQIPFPRIPFYN